MKKTLLAILFAAIFAIPAFAQIHCTGGQLYLHDGDKASYESPVDIRVSPKYNPLVSTWTVTCTVFDPSIDTNEVVEFVQTYNSADVDAFTPGVGSVTETEKLIDVIEQIVIETLEHVSANSGLTFSQ